MLRAQGVSSPPPKDDSLARAEASSTPIGAGRTPLDDEQDLLDQSGADALDIPPRLDLNPGVRRTTAR